jgi:lipase chaperone LimK
MSTTPHQGLPTWLRFAVPGALIVAACGLYIYFNAGDSAPEQKTASGSSHEAFGPGVVGNTDTGESLNKQPDVAAAPLLSPPNGLMATPDGQLLNNSSLRNVCDFFLLQQPGNNPLAALQAHLKEKLPPQAAAQAQEIAAHYQSYMQAHDAMLASQNLGTGDAERLSNWRAQRDRLRLGMLGENVVANWFQDDDNHFAQAIERLRERGPGATQTVAGGGRNLSEQEQEDNQMLDAIADETKTFSARRQEELAWNDRFKTYVAAATKIKQQPGISYMEKENQLRAELVTLFPSERQRQRARDMGP